MKTTNPNKTKKSIIPDISFEIIKRIKSEGFLQFFKKCIAYFFGTVFSVRFDKTAKICLRGPIKTIKRNGSIYVGDFTTLWPGVKLSCVGKSKVDRATIQIGKRCSIGDRSEIHAGKHVAIGNEVIIAWDCVVMDRDYHSLDGKIEDTKPVFIKDRVWVGCRSIILKGVTIGEGAVVAAGSVVTKDVAPNTLIAGNPAKPIKTVEGWRMP